jgi:hypothetical protein
MIDAVADRPSDNRPNGTPDESASKSVAAAAVVADDRASKRAKGAAGDGTLLSVRSRANASGEEDGNGQDQK